MLTPFPDLLVLGFFAPTLLRIAVAVVLLYLAYQQYMRKQEIIALRSSFGTSLSWAAIIFNIVVALMLLFGYYTQVAALLVVASQAYGLWANKRYPSVVIVPNSTVVLLIIISLSLLISGGGAFAQDLRL